MSSDKPIIVIHLLACVCGGIESWAISLMRNLKHIKWRIWIQEEGMEDPVIVQEMGSYAEIYRYKDWNAAVLYADALISPGHRFIADFPGLRILVAHGSAWYTEHLMHRFAPVSDILVAVSDAASITFPQRLRHSVKIIKNGIDLDRCRTHLSRRSVRKTWGLSDDELAIGFLGRIDSDKRPELTALAANSVGGVSIFIGAALEPTAVDLIQKCGRRVKFVKANRQVGDELIGLDAVVMCSKFEGFGLALAEVMASGIPLVTTKVGIVEELNRTHGDVVMLVSHTPTEAELQSAIGAVLSPSYKSTLIKARRIIQDTLSGPKMSEEWNNRVISKIK